jgi:hypothetical protein
MRLAGLLALAMLEGCVSHNAGIKPLKPLELATAGYQDVVTEARTGSLGYENGCLLFRDEDGKTMLLPVWPWGSSFNGTAVTFHEPAKSDQRFAIGEEVRIEGHSWSWSDIPGSYYVRFQRQCGAPPIFVAHVRQAN